MQYLFGALYIFTGLILLYYFVEYVISNIISLIRSGTLLSTGLTATENFVFDILIFVFFVSSLLFTTFQLINYLFPQLNRDSSREPQSFATPFDTIRYISTEDEVLVLDAILDFNLKAYKFEITRKVGLSKMKVHRIIQRLEQRDIIKVTKIGRNSQIRLADWLSPSSGA